MNKVLIFVKAPLPGKVKTRLCPPLLPTQAAKLYISFVKDTLEAARGAAGSQVEMLYDPATDFPDLRWLEPVLSPPFFAQKSGDLGARLD
jgi:glycosyltransferase A (GT-A) superfamily protein (DUF2064 family)